MRNDNWLEDAKELDVYVGTKNKEIYDLTHELFNDLNKRIKVRNKTRTRSALKLILLNLWIALHENKPLKYSRSPNSYSIPRRYGKLHFRYNRIIPIIDNLHQWGLVHQENGFYDHEKKLGRQTRFYASNDLIGMFHHVPNDFNMIDRQPPREPLQLKDEEKQEVDYPETEETKEMRGDLYRYNYYINKHKVKLSLNHGTPCTVNLLNSIKSNVLNGYSSILDINNNTISSSNNNVVYSDISTMTNKIRDILKNNSKLGLKDMSTIQHYDIDNITILLKYEILKRVFNKRDFNEEIFDLGGRFYGAAHIFLSEDDRASLTINDNPTVELDYSALHIRMLYHIIGMEYKDDPYGALCGNPEERKMYKLVQLIAINSANMPEAVMAIRDEFRKKHIPYDLTTKSIVKLIYKFKEAHQPIEDFLFSGIGLKLQNRDSKITESILLRLIKQNIPCLPVHDSYIVETRYRGALEQAMIEEYEEIMGFEPVID